MDVVRVTAVLLLVGVVCDVTTAQRRRGGGRGRGGRNEEGITLNPGPNECLYTFTIPNTEFRVSRSLFTASCATTRKGVALSWFSWQGG